MGDTNQSLSDEMSRSMEQADQAIERISEQMSDLQRAEKKWSRLMNVRNEVIELIAQK